MNLDIQDKKCKRCGESQPPSAFYETRGVPSSPCKKCRSVDRKIRYEKLREGKSRICNYCKKEFSFDEFQVLSPRLLRCNQCVDKINGQWKEILQNSNPKTLTSLAFNYGISVAELLDHKLTSDNCEVCGRHVDEVRLHMDHNHQTGVLRGILCINCNTALGSLRDSIEILKSMITYLENHES